MERWIIEEWIPAHVLTALAEDGKRNRKRMIYGVWLDELSGPNPVHRFDAVSGRVHRGDSSLVTRHAWEVWQTQRCWAQPVWVVQGPMGGHLRWYGDLEERVAKMVALPSAPPRPGELWYVEPDARTWARLAQQDRLRRANHELRNLTNGRALRLERERIMATCLRDMYAHVEAVCKDSLSARDVDGVPRTGDGIDYADWERREERFIKDV